MALSTSMAAGVGAGGAAMTVNPGVSFGANAMAAPQTFSSYQPPPNSGPQQTDPGTGGGRGAGGAYDLRAWEKEDLPKEDHHACLGMDVGTSSIKACLYLQDGGCKAIGGGKGLPASILVDPKTGVKGIRRWLKARESGGGAGSSAPPRGVKLFHPAAASAAAASASVAAATTASSSSSSSGEEKCEVLWPLRLMTLRGNKGAEAVQRVKSSLRHDIKIASENSTEAEDAECSGVKILLTSREAKEPRDQEVWCSPEEILAVLIAGVKAKAEDAHGVVVRTCFFTAPCCLGDLHRVALQRAAFMAGLIPGRFVGAASAATVGYFWGRPTPELKEPKDLILSVGMGASFLDVAVIAPTRSSPNNSPDASGDASPSGKPSASSESEGTAAEASTGNSSSSNKKKKKKGKSGAVSVASGEAVEYGVVAAVGDSACGGLDMDYLVARALLAAVEDVSDHSSSAEVQVSSDRSLWRNLLISANQLRERLSSEPKASCFLKAGCSDADPSFTHNLELSQTEMEDAVAGMMDVFRKSLQTALDRAGATPGEVKAVVLYGECTKTTSVTEEIIKIFDKAQIHHSVPGDCAKGASLLLAEKRGILGAVTVKARDALSHKLGLVDRVKRGDDGRSAEATVTSLFPEGSPVPTSSVRTFDRKAAGPGLTMDVEVVEWVEGSPASSTPSQEERVKRESGDGEKTSEAAVAGRWVTVQRLGNPLAMQDDSGYPVIAEEVTIRFTIDDCGICVTEVESSVVPKKRNGAPGPIRRFLNVLMAVFLVFCVLGGGYWMLYRLETAGERRQAAARVRLTAFYEKYNPDKLATVEDALRRYKGREDVLFERLKNQYGKPVPK